MTNIEDYLQRRIEETGTYKAVPVAWTLQESSSSQSVGIKIQFQILARWHDEDGPGVWSQEYPIGFFAEGTTWVVGKTGQLLDKSVQRLADAGIWNGDWDALQGDPPNRVCNVTVESEAGSDGRTYYRVNWINEFEETPRKRGAKSLAPVNQSALDSLRARFGGATKALAGSGGTPKKDPTADAEAAADYDNPKSSPVAPPPPGAPAPITEDDTSF